MDASPVGTATLIVLVTAIGGFTPMSLAWGIASPCVVKNAVVSDVTLFYAAVVTYLVHGIILECVPAPALQSGRKPSLKLRKVLPNVARNLLTARVWAASGRSVTDEVASTGTAATFLVAAVFGNEILYYAVHRALHHRRLYRYHATHHLQRTPRPLGAAFCSLVEMHAANIASFVIPLALAGAPSGVFLVWVVAAVMGTQLHHSSKKYAFCFDGHQPDFHDAHHDKVNLHYGNLFWFA
jgi:sterol desaturase/sphingolipid hydroxylase (fatty acid hydroxylase superfamily)